LLFPLRYIHLKGISILIFDRQPPYIHWSMHQINTQQPKPTLNVPTYIRRSLEEIQHFSLFCYFL